MKKKPRCFLDIEIDNEPIGRIVVELFNDICPITSENFRALCTGEKGEGKFSKKRLWYKDTIFHRVVKNFVIQSGDFETGTGTGGESIYGGQFNDENFDLRHDKPYLLSMANKGKNTNGSQFFITLQASPHLDRLHTVFGHVLSGFEVVKQIASVDCDRNNKPKQEVKIVQCGELVLRPAERRRKRKDSSSDSSSSEEEKRKKKKKHKKEKKKSKKEKKAKGFYSSSNKAEDDIPGNVDPDEIPQIPANVFLMRRTSPVTEFRSRTPRGRENYQFKRAPSSRTRSGRKVKGRGNMRYRTPSSSDERSGSETPPHWKQAQSRLKKFKDVIKEKEKDKNSESELSHEEDNENENQYNPFLQSRLGLVSARNFDDDRRRGGDDDRRRGGDDRRRGDDDDRRRGDDDDRRRGDDDDRRRGNDDVRRRGDDDVRRRGDDDRRRGDDDRRREKDARMNITESRQRRDFDHESSRYNREEEDPESLFDRLMQEDQRHGKSWFDENNKDQSDDEHSSPLRSKIVLKSSVSRRDSKDNRRGDERENHKRYDENSRRRDSSSDKRSRTFHRDSSPGYDNSYKKNTHHSENKKETNKTNDDKMIEKPKPLTGKSKKRLSLLENDLFRYAKSEIEKDPPKSSSQKRKKPKSKPVDVKNTNKDEIIMQSNSINSIHNDNLAALKEYETKSDEKFGHEGSDNMQAESSACVLDKNKTVGIVSEISNVAIHETQQSDSSSLQKVVELDKATESNISIAKLKPDVNETGNCSTSVATEEMNKELERCEKNRSPCSNFEYSPNEKIKIKEHLDEKEQIQDFNQSIEIRVEKDWNPKGVIPFVGEEKDDVENIPVEKIDKVQMNADEEREMENQNIDANVQVTENSSVGSPEVGRSECQNKEKKSKNENKKTTSLHRHSPSPDQEFHRSDKKLYDRMSKSPPQSKSPLHHKAIKKRISKSPDNLKPSSSKHSPHTRRSKSPSSRAKSPISHRKKPDTRRSKSRSRSRSAHRSSSRNRSYRRYSRSPDVRPRRSHSRNVGRGNRSYRHSGVRNRSPEFRNSFQRRNKSPLYRGRTRGRSAARRSNTRSRSHSVDKKRRHRRQDSTSSSSSSSSSRSGSVKRRNKKKNSAKGRNKRSSSSSSSSSASSRSKRSNS